MAHFGIGLQDRGGSLFRSGYSRVTPPTKSPYFTKSYYMFDRMQGMVGPEGLEPPTNPL